MFTFGYPLQHFLPKVEVFGQNTVFSGKNANFWFPIHCNIWQISKMMTPTEISTKLPYKKISSPSF